MEIADEFVKLVCNELHLSIEAVKSKCKKREIAEAKQLIAYFLCLYTPLSLWKIAEILNYKSHANILYGKKQVKLFLETDRKFKLKYAFLLPLAEDLLVDIKNGTLNTRLIKYGSICWFWNENMPFPILDIFNSFRIDYRNKVWFRTNDEAKPDFTHCKYAGRGVFPTDFKRLVPTVIIPEEPEDIQELFYSESLIPPLCEPAKEPALI